MIGAGSSKANGPASAATDPDHGSRNPLEGSTIAMIDTTHTPEPTTAENPAEAVNRLCGQLSVALNDYWHGNCTAVVRPDAASEYPISILIYRDLNAIMDAVMEYRRLHGIMIDRWEAFQQTPAGRQRNLAAAIAGDSEGYFEAKHACDLAHSKLVNLFTVSRERTIEGSAAA